MKVQILKAQSYSSVCLPEAKGHLSHVGARTHQPSNPSNTPSCGSADVDCSSVNIPSPRARDGSRGNQLWTPCTWEGWEHARSQRKGLQEKQAEIPEAVQHGGCSFHNKWFWKAPAWRCQQSLLLVPTKSHLHSTPGVTVFCSCLSWTPRASSQHSFFSHLLQVTEILRRRILLILTLLSLQ